MTQPYDKYEYIPPRMTADQMDVDRHEKMAYEYLCRLEEAKDWMEQCLQIPLPPIVEMEEKLRNGVLLAKIGNYIAPKVVSLTKIYDVDESRYKNLGLTFRHTDNIMHWFRAMESVGLMKVFYPETTDIYDKKNMPKAIYCLHALSIYLHKKYNTAPQMKTFFGTAEYTKEEISFMAKELSKYGVTMPAFNKIGGFLAAEIPIDEVALHAAIIVINEKVEDDDSRATLEALKNPNAHLVDIVDDFAEVYQKRLRNAKVRKSGVQSPQQVNGHDENEDVYTRMLTREEIQANVDRSNVKEAVYEVNEAILGNDASIFLHALRNPILQMPSLDVNSGQYYLDEFKIIHSVKKHHLDQADLLSGVYVLNAVIAINEAVDKRNEPMLQQCLGDDNTGLDDVRYENVAQYMKQFIEVKNQKPINCLLTLDEISVVIDSVNSQSKGLNEKVIVLETVNNVLDIKSTEDVDMQLFSALLENPHLNLQNVYSIDGEHYWLVLKKRREEKLRYNADPNINVIFTVEELQELIDKTNNEKLACVDQHMDAIALNKIIESNDTSNNYLQALKAFANAEDVVVFDTCEYEYRKNLEGRFKAKSAVCNNTDGVWYPVRSDSGMKFYIDIRNGEIRNHLNEDDEQCQHYLSPKEIIEIIRTTTTDHMKSEVERKTVQEYRQTKKDDFDIEHYKQNEESISKIQALMKMRLARKQYQERLEYLRAHEQEAVKIQKFYRNKKARSVRQTLNDPSTATLSTVQNFLPILTETEVDYKEEMDNENLKKDILETIRQHKQYEDDLETMDIKIRLLVKNKTTLKEVISNKNNLKSYKENGAVSPDAFNTGKFNFWTKNGRERLLCYQHLIYHLQTQPIYLSRLALIKTDIDAGNFFTIEILPVFNSATRPREEYLLLRFFRTALHEEIASQIRSVHDVVNGQSLVLRMVAVANRNAQGDEMLRSLLQPLVLRLLKNETVNVNTNPIEIYQKWRSEDEHAKHLPATVTVEEALKHEIVANCLKESMEFLEEWVLPFVDAIVKTVNQIPYSLRYMSKILRLQLKEKFPNTPDKDLLKAVGNLVYYRFINPCIVSPDLFHIIDTDVSLSMTEDDKKKLASVAKMLHFASTNMGFGEENAHLEPMNAFIIKCHKRLKQFYDEVCRVPDIDQYFAMDEFSDYAALAKPTVLISMGQLITLHKMLLENCISLTDGEKADRLNELLDDFGTSEPSVNEFFGDTDDATRNRIEKTDILLQLINKFASKLSPEEAEMRSLFLKTKIYLIDLMSCQRAIKLSQLLSMSIDEEAEGKHEELQANRQDLERMTLGEKKQKVRHNLDVLEKHSLVSKSNDYQAIVKSLAEDIRSQRAYREQRREERVKLEESLKKIQAKTKSYEDRLESYSTYLRSCVALTPDHITKKPKEVPWQSTKRETTLNKVHKASGAKLADKKVLLSIDGLKTNQLKTVTFEFKCKDNVDEFEVTAKQAGGKTEITGVYLQDLLRKQYDGVPVVDLFDQRMKFNVNMLVYFLNRKFYSGGAK